MIGYAFSKVFAMDLTFQTDFAFRNTQAIASICWGPYMYCLAKQCQKVVLLECHQLVMYLFDNLL